MIAQFGSPRPLDTFVIDGTLYPLTYRMGMLGYLKGYQFIPLDERQLVQVKDGRAGSATWTLGPPRVLPLEKEYEVAWSFHGGATETKRVRAKDVADARTKALRWFAAVNKLTYPSVFQYFKSHPLAVTVKAL